MGKGSQAARKKVLELAGLVGGDFPSSLLVEILGNDQVLVALMDEGILKPSGVEGQIRVADPASVAGEVNRLTAARQRAHWLALAEAARALRLKNEMIARYYEGAGQSIPARQFWIRAAEDACDHQAYSEALSFIQRALALWPWSEDPDDRVRFLREMARCAANARDIECVKEAWQELAKYAKDTRQFALQVDALGQLAECEEDSTRATIHYKEAAEVAEHNLPPGKAVRAMLDYLANLANRVRLAMARDYLERVILAGEASGSPAIRSEILGWKGLISAMSGNHKAAHDAVEESLRIAIEHELAEMAALAYRRRGNIADYAGNYAREISAHTEAIEFCRKSQVGDQMSCLSCMSYACYRSGDWKSALRSAGTVLADPRSPRGLQGMALCVQGLIFTFRGERKRAETQLQESLMFLRQEGIVGMEFLAMMGQGFLKILDGERDAATRIYDDIRSLWRETNDVHDVVPAMLFAGSHYAKEGHADRLADCVDILMTVVRHNPLDECKAALIALKGEQSNVDGEVGAFIRAMDTASILYGSCGLPLEEVWTGISATSAGSRTDEASRHVAMAKRLGLRPFLAMSKNAVPGKDSATCDLTPRQFEVLHLLALGFTGKEMASRLGLSVRTVEMHVSRLLERLNCRTRPEAVRLAVERGWMAGDQENRFHEE